MKRMKIDEIWAGLENEETFFKGLLLRRYSGAVIPDVFIALSSPEKYRSIAASISSSVTLNLSAFSNLQDISIELLPDEKRGNKNILVFKLLNNQHRDIFSVLCEDLFASISTVTNEQQLVGELINRFEKWKSLFDSVGAQGLSSEEQRGLFGELYFLRKFLRNSSEFKNIISSWVGPERQIRDFQYGNWAVEVKTTSGNNHQTVTITSERQLDTSHVSNLFLYHMSLEVQQHSGETLNQIIYSVIELLDSDFVSINRFKAKLLEGGYYELQGPLYADIGYRIRQELFYEVERAFPRIEEGDLLSGVSDVCYTITLSNCSEYIRTEEEIFQTLTFL